MTPDEIQLKILPYLAGIAVFLIFRAYLITRLLKLVKPLAAEMGVLSAELLAFKDLNYKAKKVVSSISKNPVHPLFMWLATLLYIPLSLLGHVKKFTDPIESMSLESKQKFEKVVSYHFLINAARSPFLFLVLALEILIMTLLIKHPLTALVKATYWVTDHKMLLHSLKMQDC